MGRSNSTELRLSVECVSGTDAIVEDRSRGSGSGDDLLMGGGGGVAVRHELLGDEKLLGGSFGGLMTTGDVARRCGFVTSKSLNCTIR